MIKRVFITLTDDNRGLEQEFVRQYCEDGWRVYAACRHPAEAIELQNLSRIFSELSLHRLDISESEDNVRIRKELHHIPLDLLIAHTGGALDENGFRLGSIRYDDWRRTLEVNTLGTVRIVEALLENLSQSPATPLVAVVSGLSPPADSPGHKPRLYYDSSMAALNTAMTDLKLELAHRRVGVLLLDPGQVMTPPEGSEGILPHLSVAGMREAIAHFRIEQSGSMIRYDGTIISDGGGT